RVTCMVALKVLSSGFRFSAATAIGLLSARIIFRVHFSVAASGEQIGNSNPGFSGKASSGGQVPYQLRFVRSQIVAPRAYWKGYLKLSLVSCPVALFPASSEREKISFNQINKKTGNRIRYRKVDAENGEEVDSADIVKGYEVGKGEYIEIEPEELEAIAIESNRTIEIDEFVPKKKSTSCI